MSRLLDGDAHVSIFVKKKVVISFGQPGNFIDVLLEFEEIFRQSIVSAMPISSARRVLFESLPFFYPFGNTPWNNALEGFDTCEPADAELKVR